MSRHKILGVLLAVSVLGASVLAACSDGTTEDGGGGAGGADVSNGGMSSGTGGDSPAATGGAPSIPGLVGGGLVLKIGAVAVSSEGVATVDFTITDDDERPLDLNGTYTEGAVQPNFILSYLEQNSAGESTQYVAYTTRKKVTTDGKKSAIQSATDSGGTFTTLAIGSYRYTFGTKIEISKAHSKLTHTVGVYATREVSTVRFVANETKSWVPAGGDVKTTLDVVTDKACNSCHTRLEGHGGARRTIEMCSLCHTEANSINPETGNTIDLQVMIHKIHMGENLPSVLGGTPYTFVGYQDRVSDFSTTVYPWDMRDCTKCHQGSQGDRWVNRPAQKPCTSCHDRTYFGSDETPEGWTKHTAGPRKDNECIVCHGEDSLEPISKSHVTRLSDPNRTKLKAEIIGIESTAPGEKPLLEFRVTSNGTPVDILATPINRLRLRVYGPTTDVVISLPETLINNGIAVAECAGSPVPPCLEKKGDGFVYHLNTPIPSTARGSYFVGLDGRVTEAGVNIAFVNPVKVFAVTGEIAERRPIVNREKCNACHGDLAEHGGGYSEPLYCLNCHRAGAYEEAPDVLNPGDDIFMGSLTFKDFIHRKHSEAKYPAPLNDCAKCHVDESNLVPLAFEKLLPSTYATLVCAELATSCDGMGGAINTPVETIYQVQPEGAACTSCHDDDAAKAHAETNTSANGEACGTCHGPGKTYDVAVVHQLEP